jgi:acetylornithine deacetylase/succinyl-diaminopimelate desuccinylase-like protein
MPDDLHDQPAELLRRLIRFDTTNPPGNERACVAFVEELARDAGLETRIVAREEERPSLVARLPGRGDAPPLLLHGHVDVVTTEGQQWKHDPFEAVVEDGFVWGRGALDMKGGVAMMIAATLRAAASGEPPPGDVLLTILSDEEAGSQLGAKFLVEEHPELFEGVEHALGEFGGFDMEVAGKRFFLVEVAEKEVCWCRARIHGPGGHGSLPMHGGTMAKLGRALSRLDRKRLPVHVTPVARRMIETIASELPLPMATPLRALLRPALTDRVLGVLGERGAPFDPLLHNTVNATVVHGGDKVNVVPSEVELLLDGRLLPGQSPKDLLRELRSLLGDDVEVEVELNDPGTGEPDMALWDVLAGSLHAEDPGATVVPFLMPGVSDARFFARLGIQTYGFLPMRLPSDLNFMSLIHAADERIPVDAVEFGTRAIERVLAAPRPG